MAKNSSLEDLYITLGLDVSELTSDFIEVDKTITENIARINRDKNFIKLNAQIDMNNLDPVKDAQEILKIKSNELNDIIEGQQQKVKLLEAAWLDLANSHGYSSDIARRAEETHLRETVALQELEKELERLKATQENASDEQLSVFAQALQSDDVTTALESIENAFSNMTEEVAESNPILQKAVNIISKFKNPYIVAGAGAVAMATLPLVAHKASEELINMARPAIEAGDAIYQLSRRMGESVKSASQFNDACKLAGTDADYLLEQLEDLSKDWLTGGSEKTEALKAFGVDFTDDEGNLKSYHDRMVELAEGMNRAAEAGQKLEYQQMLTEENTAEMVTAVENYGLALERVGGIEKNGLTDPLKAKDLGFDLRALDAQANELSNAFSAALIPVAEHLIPTVTSSLKYMVEVINQNKDTIKDLGDIAGTALSSIAGLAKYAANALVAVGAGLKEVLQDKQSAEMNIVIKNKNSKGESLGIDTYCYRR